MVVICDIMGLLGEDGDEVFEAVYNAIKEWQPKQKYNSESEYHEDLFQFLSSRAKKYPPQKESGRHLADIGIGDRVENVERVGREKINREKGFLYYIGKDGYVWRTSMQTSKGRKEKVGKEHIQVEYGYVYFLDKEGYAARTKQI